MSPFFAGSSESSMGASGEMSSTGGIGALQPPDQGLDLGLTDLYPR